VSEPERIDDARAKREALVCLFCSAGVGLEQARTISGQTIIRCRDVMTCDRRWREQGAEQRESPIV
jgi:hypothetical protein